MPVRDGGLLCSPDRCDVEKLSSGAFLVLDDLLLPFYRICAAAINHSCVGRPAMGADVLDVSVAGITCRSWLALGSNARKWLANIFLF